MIAARFRLIAWVAGCAFAALLCYMASQSVAAERSGLAHVDSQIADTQNDIRRLETEIAARSRMGQLERWNQTLALQAARPAQYVANEVQLASLAGGPKRPLEGNIQMAAYQPTPVTAVPVTAAQPAPAQPAAPAIQQPMLREATYVRPKPSRLNDDDDAPVVKASLDKPTPRVIVIARPAKLTLASLELPVRKPILNDDLAPIPRRKAVNTDVGLLPSDLGTLIAAEKKGAHKQAAR